MSTALADWSALNPREAQLLVSRQAPHVVVSATPAWLAAAGYNEREAVGRALAVLLHGDGTCMVTAGALWQAVQVNAPESTPACPAPWALWPPPPGGALQPPGSRDNN